MARRRSRRRIEPNPVPQPVVKPAPPTLQSTLVFLGIVLYLGTTVFRLGVQEFHLLKQARLLEEEKAAIAAQHQDLRSQIASAKTNAGIERLAREELGFVMAQEIPVKTIVPAQPVAQVAAVAPAFVAEGTPNRVGDTASPSMTAVAPATAQVGLPPAMAALSKYFLPLWQ